MKLYFTTLIFAAPVYSKIMIPSKLPVIIYIFVWITNSQQPEQSVIIIKPNLKNIALILNGLVQDGPI